MNPQATTAFQTLLNTIAFFFEHGGSGYPPDHPLAKSGYWVDHPLAKRRLASPKAATIEDALALVASADFILGERAKRGRHYHPQLEVIERQREELLEALDQVPGKPATAVAAGRRSA